MGQIVCMYSIGDFMTKTLHSIFWISTFQESYELLNSPFSVVICTNNLIILFVCVVWFAVSYLCVIKCMYIYSARSQDPGYQGAHQSLASSDGRRVKRLERQMNRVSYNIYIYIYICIDIYFCLVICFG